MKAFLLAAGEGTRLQPLTFHTPKCLVPVCGRPLIEYWFDLFRLHGIDEVLINTSYLADQVREYMKHNSGDLHIELVHEEKLLGSGGTIKRNWDFVKKEEAFFILYADNLTNINLTNMFKFHLKSKKDFTLAIFKVANPGECGIVDLNKDLSIASFTEKPKNPASDLAFAGIMVCTTRLKYFFPDENFFDLGYDVLPRIIKHASGYIVDDYLIDIGTPEKLKLAEWDVRNKLLEK